MSPDGFFKRFPESRPLFTRPPHARSRTVVGRWIFREARALSAAAIFIAFQPVDDGRGFFFPFAPRWTLAEFQEKYRHTRRYCMILSEKCVIINRVEQPKGRRTVRALVRVCCVRFSARAS